MRRLDAIHGGDRDWEAVIDEAVAQRLDGEHLETTQPADADETTAAAITDPGADAEPAIADDGEGDGLQCTSCGKDLDDDDRFCSHCGTAVDTSDKPSTATEVAG